MKSRFAMLVVVSIVVFIVSLFSPAASAQGDVPVEISPGCYIMKNKDSPDSCKIKCSTGNDALKAFGAGNAGNANELLKKFRSENGLDISDSSIKVAANYYYKNRNFLFNGEGRGEEEIVISIPLRREIL